MGEFFQGIDNTVFLWLNGLHSPFFDSIMSIISYKWTWVPLYATILFAVVARNNYKTALAAVILFTLTIFAADTLCNDYIRPFLHRPRPSWPDSGISHLVHLVNGKRGGHYGLPSCHAANSFALFTLTYLYFRNKRLSVFMLVWAVIHSYSRIYLGVHYPGDILLGGIIGCIIAFLLYKAYRMLLKPKEEPYSKNVVFVPYVGIAIYVLVFLAAIFGVSIGK